MKLVNNPKYNFLLGGGGGGEVLRDVCHIKGYMYQSCIEGNLFITEGAYMYDKKTNN